MLRTSHLVFILTLAVLELALGLSLWGRMPERVPVHYSLDGAADAFGPAWVVAVLFPALSFLLAAVFWGLPLLGPFRANVERFSLAYGRIVCVIMTALTATGVILILNASGWQINVGRAFSIVFGAMMLVLGNWMGKIRRNFWMGLRTPWTLANETVWYRTHRAGGRLLMGIGAACLIAGLTLPASGCFVVFIVGVGVLLVWSLVYSCREYRRLGGADELEHATAP